MNELKKSLGFERHSCVRITGLSSLLLVTAVFLLASTRVYPQADDENCRQLSGENIRGIAVTGTEWLRIDANGSHEVCRVTGHRPPFLDIEVVLPAKWSGRYLQQGGSGIDGRISSAIGRNGADKAITLHPVVTDYDAVYAASNGGHRMDTPGQAGPEVWLGDGTEAKASFRDFSYLALQETLDFAHGLTTKLYGRLPDYGYFNGSSNGGRHAYIVAERWPQHFDGIIAGKETMNISGTAIAWARIGSIAGTAAVPSDKQYKYAYQAALSHCDGNDGTLDGIMMNPYECDFSPQSLACETTPSEQCLSTAQVDTLEMLLSDIVDADGNVISSAFPWTDFSEFAQYFPAYAGISGLIATGDAAWLTPERLAAFDANRDQYMIIAGMRRAGAGHDMIAIAQYVASGKKLISWHGGIDNLHPAKDHERMFTQMLETAAAIAKGSNINVADNATFFIIPGAKHSDGSYPAVDWISALIEWVEKGIAPQNLIHKRADGSHIQVLRK